MAFVYVPFEAPSGLLDLRARGLGGVDGGRGVLCADAGDAGTLEHGPSVGPLTPSCRSGDWSCSRSSGPMSSAGCLRCASFDEGIAWIAPERKHAAGAAGDPRGAVHVGERGWLAVLGGRLTVVVDHERFDLGRDQAADRSVDRCPYLVRGKWPGDVLEAVDDDRLGAERPHEFGELLRFTHEVERKRARPDAKPPLEALGVLLADHPSHGARDLARPVGCDVEHGAGVDDRVADHGRFGDAGASERDLLSERGFPDALRAGDQQALALGPEDFGAFAPDRGDGGGRVEDERSAVP